MIRHTITVMGKTTVYWERNPQWTQTIVMLHGFRGNHSGLLDIVQHFDGYRLILPDLPGYGESERLAVPHTLANYALWLDGFAGALGLKDYVSWSHSYSGSIALIQAAKGKHKPSSMVSVSLAAVRRDWPSALSTFYYWFGQLMPGWLQRRWIASKTVDHATGRWLFHTVTAERRRALVKRGDRNLHVLIPSVVIEQYMSSLNTNLKLYAPKVDLPVLLIAGAKDVIVPVRELVKLQRLMPDATLEIMPDQGHLAPLEKPATTASMTKRFINGL